MSLVAQPGFLRGNIRAAVAPVYDSDATAWFQAVESTGAMFGPDVEAVLSNKQAFSTCFSAFKANGAWGAIETACFFSAITTFAGTLVPIKGSNVPSTGGGLDSTFYDRVNGLGAISSAGPFLTTGRNNNSDGQNNHHIALWVGAAPVASTNGGLSANIASGARKQIYRAGGNLITRSNSTTADTLTGVGFSANSLTGISRSASANYTRRTAGANTLLTRATATQVTNAIRLFWADGVAQPFDGRVRFYSLGGDIDLALLETPLAALFSALV